MTIIEAPAYTAPPDEVVWLRDLDGTGSMHPCTPYCPGAVEYVRADLVVSSRAMAEEVAAGVGA